MINDLDQGGEKDSIQSNMYDDGAVVKQIHLLGLAVA